MNVKQTTPLAVTLAPLIAAAPELVLIGAVGCGIYFGLKWLLSDDDDKKPDAPPSSPSASERPVFRPVISSGNTVEKPHIPQNSAGISNPPRPASAPSAPAAPVVKIQPEIPLPARKKFISREDMAEIFSDGCGLTRAAAVSALKAFGFGKTAAYQALEINGRFAPWLQFAPDGMITWKRPEVRGMI